MRTTLTLRPFRETDRFHHGDHVSQYTVHELPPGDRIVISEMEHRWQILRTQGGHQGDWTGDYKSAEDALAAIQKEFEA